MSAAVLSRPARVTSAQVAALLPPFVVVALSDLGQVAPIMVVALVAALGWEALFGMLRHRGPSVHGITTALIVATLCPVDVAVWQVVVMVSLGVVLGELVFGGRGFGFLHPASVALALFIISSPDVQLRVPTQSLALAVLPGAGLLLALGLVSARVMFATALGVALVFLLRGQSLDPLSMAIGLAFGTVFIVADPIAAAVTNVGRWVYGALAGCLIAVFSPTGGITAEAVVFAALIAATFAPLIDHLAVMGHAYRWRARHDA